MKKDGYKCNCRKVILLFCGIFFTNSLLAQEPLAFVAETDTVAYHWTRREYVAINAGDVIIANAVGYGWMSPLSVQPLSDFTNILHLLIYFGERINGYSTFAKNFRPLNTEAVFGSDIFIDYPVEHRVRNGPTLVNPAVIIGDVDAMWIPDYYTDILKAQDRGRLLYLRPGLVALTEPDEGSGLTTFWYEFPYADIRNGRAMFFNSVIQLGIGTNLAVRNIQLANFGYIVDCVLSASDTRNPWDSISALAGTPFWNAYYPGDAVTLLLFLDGDYLDIYTHGSDIHVGTFIRVGREFIAQYQSLIRTNTSDLTNVVWPQRAGVIRRPVLPVVEIAVPVEIEEEPVAVQVEDVAIVAIEAPPVAVIENAPTTGAMPLWAWFAIGGGAIAVAGGVFVARRKR